MEVAHDGFCLAVLLQAATELFEKYRGNAPADRKLLPQAMAMACKYFVRQFLVCTPGTQKNIVGESRRTFLPASFNPVF